MSEGATGPLVVGSGGRIVGRQQAGPEGDKRETPAWAVRALLAGEADIGWPVEAHSGAVIWEPACGRGAIVNELRRHGHTVMASDIEPQLPGALQLDFLGPRSLLPWAAPLHIVTNPPFSLALEFARRAVALATYRVALFLRIQFLESAKRYPFLKDPGLRTVHVFSARCSTAPFDAAELGHNGTAMHAWFVWQRGWEGRPEINLLDPECWNAKAPEAGP